MPLVRDGEQPVGSERGEPAAGGQNAHVDQVRDLGAGHAPAVAGPVGEQFVLALKRMELDALLADPNRGSTPKSHHSMGRPDTHMPSTLPR